MRQKFLMASTWDEGSSIPPLKSPPEIAADRSLSTTVSAPQMSNNNNAQSTGSIMSQPATDLAPPKDDPMTVEQLKQFDGATVDTPIYVAIKGSSRYG